MESKITHTTFDNNPQWNTIEIKQKWSTWTVSGHSDGDIDIECHTDDNGSEHLFLNQTELKEMIAFLQTKIQQ